MAGRGPVLFSNLQPVKYTDVHRHGNGPLGPGAINRNAKRAIKKASSRASKRKGQAGADETRKRQVTSAPLGMSDLEILEFVVCLLPFLETGAKLEAEIVAKSKNWGGRKREYTATGVMAFEVAAWIFDSYTDTENNLRDEKNWDRLWTAVSNAYPDQPELWLPPAPPSRDQHYRCRRDHLRGSLLAEMKKRLRAAAAEAGVDIGVLVPEERNSTTNPELFIAGDGTYIRSPYKTHHSNAFDPATGKTRRTDFEAGKYRGKKREGYGGPGYTAVILAARSPYGNERIIFDVGLQSGGRGEESEANLATRMFLALLDDHPDEFKHVRGMIYDMALRSRDQDRLLDAGKIPIVKIPYAPSGDPAWQNLGPYTFTNKHGQTTQQVVYAVNGTPCILGTDGNGVQWYVPLQRKQTKIEGKKPGKRRVYGLWAIQNTGIITGLGLGGFGGAVTRIRHDTPLVDRKNKRRTSALSVIPESDPWFPKVYGKREDLESINSVIKRGLLNQRSRTTGKNKVLFMLLMFQLLTIAVAVYAHHARTGADNSKWFGNHQCPKHVAEEHNCPTWVEP